MNRTIAPFHNEQNPLQLSYVFMHFFHHRFSLNRSKFSRQNKASDRITDWLRQITSEVCLLFTNRSISRDINLSFSRVSVRPIRFCFDLSSLLSICFASFASKLCSLYTLASKYVLIVRETGSVCFACSVLPIFRVVYGACV